MTQNNALRLVLHVDVADAWVEVPEKIVSKLGILKRLSSKSHYFDSRKLYFIEQTTDGETLFEALRFHGIKYDVFKVQHPYHAFVRFLPEVGS